MDINKPLTKENLEKLFEKLIEPKPKEIQLNQKAYDLLVKKLGYEPINVKINNYLPDNQALMYEIENYPFDYKYIKV